MTNYTQQRFIFLTLDPVHIGAGGYRLGRVDNTIIREPGSNLPKIPGTSLAGAARSYAAMLYERPYAAGQHAEYATKRPVTEPQKDKDAIIYTFGTATNSGGGQAGTVSISDARLLFLPVASQNGAVWVSTREILTEVWGASCLKLPELPLARSANPVENPPPANPAENTANFLVTSMPVSNSRKQINLGWLLLEALPGLEVTPPKSITTEGIATEDWENAWGSIASRLVLVDQSLFTQIVNSNLEVRTSVSIDPETGAAKSGALFTYEALPRATWLWCDVVEDDYHNSTKNFTSLTDPKAITLGHEKPMDVVKAGLGLIKYLGVGGMGTRGFGRILHVTDWQV